MSLNEAERIIEHARQLAQQNTAKYEAAATPAAPFGLELVKPERIVPVFVESDEEVAARRKVREDAVRQRLTDAAGVPARYAAAQLQTFAGVPEEHREAYKRVAWALRGRLQQAATVALIGERGPGKTHMGCALVNEFNMSLRPAMYAVTLDFFNAIRSEYGKKGGDEARALERFTRPVLLVLDEVQERGESEWENRMLTRVLDQRYADDKATLLISNQERAEFARSVGASVSDRIRDGGGVIECKWPSLRGRVAPRALGGAA